jgi:DNA-binding MarR family transcriptional regulator
VVRVGRGRYIIADSQSGANSPQGLDDARARISEALADGRPRYRAELTTVVGLRNFSSAITTLCRAGAIVRVARGWYAKSGVALPCEERERDSEPARRQRLLSALLHGLLTSPRDAAELQDALGISRQVVVAQLKRMIDRGEVHRVALVAEQERYAYIRVGGPGPGVLSSRIPRLRKGAAGLLSRLTPEKPARLSDVAGLGKRGYVKRGVIEELQGLGLIERVGETKTPLIRLTSRGRDHPQYDAGAPKAPVLEDVIAGEARVRAILLALRALATATAMDLGLVTGIPRARQASVFRTTRWLLRLRALGLVETDGRRMASRPAYRLTKFGDEFVATLEGAAAVADAVEVQTRLAELRARWRDQQIARFGLGE